jgi:protein involved in polysaccharide export with SLBB domain
MTKESGEVTIEEDQTLRELVARLALVSSAEKAPEKREQVFVTLARHGSQLCSNSVFDFDSGRAPEIKLQDGDFITISPRETARVWIFGNVNLPGQYDVAVGSNFLQALAAAGGPRADATLRDVQLMRGTTTSKVDLSKAALGSTDKLGIVEAGDILLVGVNNRRIAVLGQVNVPGLRYLNDDVEVRVADAISMAGGLTKRGPANRITILRPQANGTVTKIPVDFSKFLSKGDIASNPLLLSGDVVTVGETPRIDLGEAIGLALGVFGLRNILR